MDYKSAGVDVEAGDQLVDWLEKEASQNAEKSPEYLENKKRVHSGIGGFASLFDIQFSEMKKPLLVTCTDGVGTKVLLASHFEDYSGVGQDLVAMCVNDLLCTGGQPLQFLDYFATGQLDLNQAQAFLKSVQKACADSDCVLIGGETAEMPGVYHGKDFDCAGFAVGIVDQEKAWGATRVRTGDILIGLKSSGFHSNGYSLLRKIFAADLETYKKALLQPTRLYVEPIKKLKAAGLHEKVHAASHITGGGVQNIPRVLPQGLGVSLKPWRLSRDYEEVCKRTGKDFFAMAEVLNMGLGFVLIVDPQDQEAVLKVLNGDSARAQGDGSNLVDAFAWVLGEVVSQEGLHWKS